MPLGTTGRDFLRASNNAAKPSLGFLTPEQRKFLDTLPPEVLCSEVARHRESVQSCGRQTETWPRTSLAGTEVSGCLNQWLPQRSFLKSTFSSSPMIGMRKRLF